MTPFVDLRKYQLTKLCTSRAASLPGSSAIEKLDDAPGGGYQVTVYDPEGFPINLLHGQQEGSEEEHLDGVKSPFAHKLVYNHAKEKARLGAYQRFTTGPAAVYRVRLVHLLISCPQSGGPDLVADHQVNTDS